MTITTAVTRATLVVAALAALSVTAEAQRTTTTTRRQPAIEIRGRVPTPQVVTVRPREVPTYSRQVLVPNFYDHDFWPSITPGYQLVNQRVISGRVPGDTSTAPMAPAGGGSMNRLTTPAPTPATPADTVRRSTPGTDPARTPR
jgi:hypothetical protein